MIDKVKMSMKVWKYEAPEQVHGFIKFNADPVKYTDQKLKQIDASVAAAATATSTMVDVHWLDKAAVNVLCFWAAQ